MNSPGSELASLALRLYERDIRRQVEPHANGHFIVINLDTGEYELDPDDVVASRRARQRFPTARLFALRVGRPAAYRMGLRTRVAQP